MAKVSRVGVCRRQLCGHIHVRTHVIPTNALACAHTTLCGCAHSYVFKFTRQPYFAYVLLPSAGLLSLHLVLLNSAMSRPHKFYYIHLLSIYAPLNLILFTVFLTTNPHEAWFVFPLLLTSIPMLAHYIIAFHAGDPHKWFYIITTTASCIAGLFFLVWYQSSLFPSCKSGDLTSSPWYRAVTPTDHPWFVYPWLALGVIVAGYYVIDYQPNAFKRGGEMGLRLLQSVWTKAHGLRPNAASESKPSGPSGTLYAVSIGRPS